MDTIRVLLVDDHAVLRAGMRMLLDAEPGMHVVGEGGAAKRACGWRRSCAPTWW